MDALEQRLCSLIAARERDLRAELARHVAIPTGHNHMPGLDEYRHLLSERLRALGATLETIPGDPRPGWLGESAGPIPPTLIAHAPAGHGPRLLISGHLDTVFHPDEPFRSMTISPDGLTATGPGVVDMKGGILVAIEALEALAAAGIHANWTVVLNSDEETGSYHSDRVLRDQAQRHDIGLALEPATPPVAGSREWGLVTARKGSGSFMVEVRGRTAHAGRDFENGVSAVYALARVLNRLEAMSDLPRGLTVNVGPVRCTQAANVVPDLARAWGNVRYPDDDVAAVARGALEALATAPDAMPAVLVESCFNRPAKPETIASRDLAEFIRATARDLGQPLAFTSTGGVCDGNILQAAGLATIDTLGVRGGGLHTHREWIELASLVERAQVLALVVKRLATGALDHPRAAGA